MPGLDRDLWKEADRVMLRALTAPCEVGGKDSPSVTECGGILETLRAFAWWTSPRLLRRQLRSRSLGTVILCSDGKTGSQKEFNENHFLVYEKSLAGFEGRE